MSRGLKQFIYGLFYLIVIALVVWGAVFSFDFEGSSQGEKEVKEEKDYSSVKVAQEPKFFQLETGETSFFVKFANPNSEAEISFSYKFIAFGEDGKKIGEVRGNDLLLPLAKEVTTGFKELERPVKDIEFKIFNESYVSDSSSFGGDLEARNVSVEMEEKKAKIVGVLKNKGLLSLAKVEIVGVLADEFGFQLCAGSTVLENVDSFGEKEFEIFVPVDREIKKKMDATSTRVYVNIE